MLYQVGTSQGAVGLEIHSHITLKKDGDRELLFARNVALLLERFQFNSFNYKISEKLIQVRSPLEKESGGLIMEILIW